MLQIAFESDLSLILATNYRTLAEEGLFTKLLDITQDFKKTHCYYYGEGQVPLAFF
jgi:hypothetical protein